MLAHIALDGEHLMIEQVVEAAYADPGEITCTLSGHTRARATARAASASCRAVPPSSARPMR
jgi:hypothetical protein